MLSDWQAEELLQEMNKDEMETEFLDRSEANQLDDTPVSHIEFNKSDYLNEVNFLRGHACTVIFNYHSYLINLFSGTGCFG